MTALKLAPRILLGVAVATSTALFAPAQFVNRLGLQPFLSEYRTYIGAAFLLSTALLLAYAVTHSTTFVGRQIAGYYRRFSYYRMLTRLTPQEKSVLKQYVDRRQTTRPYPYANGVIGGLTIKGILYRGSNLSSYGDLFDFNLNTWAFERLSKKPELLVGATPDTDDEYENDDVRVM